MKSVSQCKMKGFRKLQQALLDEKEVTCPVCQEMLDRNGFDMGRFQQDIEAHGQGIDFKEPQILQPQGRDAVEKEDEAEASSKEAEEVFPSYIQYVESFGKTFTLLPPKSFGKTLPVRCNLCRTKGWPKGKVMDLTRSKQSIAKHFLKQHMKSARHQRMVRELAAQEAGPPPMRTVSCCALNLDDNEKANCLAKFKDEFLLWAGMANLQELGSHSYWLDKSTGTWFVRARDCAKHVEVKASMAEEPTVCEKCLALGHSHSVVRSAQRFALKYYSAELLSSRLFSGQNGNGQTMKGVVVLVPSHLFCFIKWMGTPY